MSKKVLILLVLSILNISGYSQNRKLYKYLTLGSTQFVSGFLDGTVETISHHYSYFKRVFPNTNDGFWNPEISWRNKYKLGDPNLGPKFIGSKTIFAWSTDAYHLLRSSKRMIDIGTISLYANQEMTFHKIEMKEKKSTKIKRWLLDMVYISAVRSLGFTLSYTLIFRK